MSLVRPGKPRYCPDCGASQPLSAKVCGICGEPLPTAAELARLWDPPWYDESNDSDAADLYAQPSSFAVSSQATTPIDRQTSYSFREPPVIASGQTQPELEAAGSHAPNGPPGWLLGLAGLVIIAFVILVFYYLVRGSHGFDLPAFGSRSIG